jgi:hypothetical protein
MDDHPIPLRVDAVTARFEPHSDASAASLRWTELRRNVKVIRR